jgi:hypothetical protein
VAVTLGKDNGLCLRFRWSEALCAPGGIRTPNLLIRSQMLYPLSHGCGRLLRLPAAEQHRESVSAHAAPTNRERRA